MNKRIQSFAITAAIALLGGTAAWAQDEEGPDPLGGVIADMQVAGGRLGRQLTDKPTQQKQKDAVEKLDVLIKILLEKRGQNGSGGGGNMPLEESKIVGGPGGSGPLHDANRKGRAWGQLPAHKREQILQSMTEGFPPHYQQLLERYYRRLAEEKPASEISAEGPIAAKSSSQTSPPVTAPVGAAPAETKSP